MANKVCTAKEAIELVHDGDTVAIGGCTIRRHPMGLVREIIRAGRRDLTLIGWNNGMDFELLIGAGCARRVETSYVGLYMYGMAPRFRRAVERGDVVVEDWSETTAIDRFIAGSKGLTFFPSKAPLGSGIMTKGSSVVDITCPFTGERYAALRAASPDVAIIHAHYADRRGNVGLLERRNKDNDVDIYIAKSARRVIVSVERIVSEEYIECHPWQTVLPEFFVDRVVQMPFGAHPNSCDYWYDYDAEHIKEYKSVAETEERFRGYLERYVFGPTTHEQYLEVVGMARLEGLRPKESPIA